MQGFFDCYRNEKRRRIARGLRLDVIAESVSAQLQRDRTDRSLAQVVGEITDRQKDQMMLAGGEHNPPDGDLWSQLARSERAGYVTGVLSCEGHDARLLEASVAQRYSNAISRWYGVDTTSDDASDVDEKRAPIRILDVMRQLGQRDP